jgi:hypothetical protein
MVASSVLVLMTTLMMPVMAMMMETEGDLLMAMIQVTRDLT